MFSKALVGVDFSPPSAAILSCLPHLKDHGMREVVLGHVVYVSNTPGLEIMLEDWAKPLLAAEAAKLEEAGLAVTTDIHMGVPAVSLAEMAEKHDVSVIVVGSHGRSLLGRVLLGSVSAGVLHQARRPVLLVRVSIRESENGTTCEAPCDRLFDRILFATDFSDGSELAFAHLKKIAADAHSPCTLLHVQDEAILKHQMGHLAEFNAIDTTRLERMRSELLAAGAASVDCRIVMGSPARSIVEETKDGMHSLVVMGTQGRGALAEIMVGSIAMNVARLAPVPVLFVPARC